MLERKRVKDALLDVWESDDYIQELEDSSINAEALLRVSAFARHKSIVMEIGCGEGTKLNRICKFAISDVGVGVDLSMRSLKHGKSMYDLTFMRADGEVLPFKENASDVTLSMYTLEHLPNPEAVIEEMIRITKKEGYIIFLAPNYGSPLFPSPCNRKNILTRFIWAMVLQISSSPQLNWASVTPRVKEKWQSDFDCVVEPFLPSLDRFLAKRKVHVVISKSIWPKGFRAKSLFLLRPLLPSWGPQLLIIGRKQTG